MSIFREIRLNTSRQQRCVRTIEPTAPAIIAEYRKQELERYRVPEQAFEFVLGPGTKSVVAPLKKGVGTNSLYLFAYCTSNSCWQSL